MFNLFKKSSEPTGPTGPYKEASTNLIYQLLFSDDLALFRANTKGDTSEYPFNILFNDGSSAAELERVGDDRSVDPRFRMLAYNLAMAKGHTPARRELLAVIVEAGFDLGLDTLASFSNGTARYINQSGKLIIWEASNETSQAITQELFNRGAEVVSQIGPWDQPRRPHPQKGVVRLSFLVSDGLYFGEGPINVLFNDPLAKPTLDAATQLMQFLISLDQK